MKPFALAKMRDAGPKIVAEAGGVSLNCARNWLKDGKVPFRRRAGLASVLGCLADDLAPKATIAPAKKRGGK